MLDVSSFQRYSSIHLFSDPPENLLITPSANGVVRVREGSNLTLICYSNGSPKPTFSWTRIRQFYREKLTENQVKSSIHFPYIDKTQADQYECAAVNIRGKRTAVVIMDVLCMYLFYHFNISSTFGRIFIYIFLDSHFLC